MWIDYFWRFSFKALTFGLDGAANAPRADRLAGSCGLVSYSFRFEPFGVKYFYFAPKSRAGAASRALITTSVRSGIPIE